jgi:L-iditol 2-dehydrogenase
MKHIPPKMLAVVAYGPHDYRLEEVPTPQPGKEEILVKVEACGICAGDVKSYKGAPMFWGDEIQPPWNKPPVIPGHEFIGRVVALGEGAEEKHGVKVGDRVTAEQIVPCWECLFCKTGRYWMCEVHNIHGHQGGIADGGMAEYMKFSSRDIVHKVPEEIPSHHGVMIEPLACSIHTIERANISFQDVVVIAGLGPIGLCKLQVARLKNPKLLIGLDLKPKRLELAKKLGADMVVDVSREDPVEVVKKLTGGYGCDVYIHNTGHPSGVIQGLKMLRKLGTFVEFSVFAEATTVDWSIIGDRKELNIYGAHISPYTYPTAIKFLKEKLVRVDEIVTHRISLKDWEKGFKLAEEGQKAIKVALIP